MDTMRYMSSCSTMMYSPQMYRALNGVFSIYKPAGQGMRGVLWALQTKLARELNEMDAGPPKRILKFNEEPDNTGIPMVTSVPDLRDHSLVLGPRYLEEDIRVAFVGPLARQSSGVTLIGIGRGKRLMPVIAHAKLMRVYHIEGELGRATHDFSSEGRIRERSTYRHVTQAKLDRVIAAIQAAHLKQMFTSAGVDPESQEAYELASRGLLRPKDGKAGTVMYSAKCINFKPPNFTMEVHTIGETCEYLRQCVHNAGLQLKTNAVCTRLRRVRYGHLNLSHALVKNQWDTGSILDNIHLCRMLLPSESLAHRHDMAPVDRIESPQRPLLEDIDR